MAEQEVVARVRRPKVVQSIPAINFYDLGTEFTQGYAGMVRIIDDWCGTPPPKPWPVPQPVLVPLPLLVRLFALRTITGD
jgi:hypothetical protein